jgi:hypothetical protein
MQVGGPFVTIARCHRCDKFYVSRFFKGHGCEKEPKT